MPSDLPTYDELPEVPGLDGLRHAWDVWGRDDALGSINLLTPERVAHAATHVRTGELVPLDLPLNLPSPPLYGREAYVHHVKALSRNEMDDRLDNFHPQGSTQWDALNHVRCREHGYWGGRTQDPTEGPNGLGIHHVARHGLAGRGVLIDVGRYLAAQPGGFDPLAPRAVTVDEVRATLDHQGVTLQPGDIWCVRFGWVAAYATLTPEQRVAYATEPVFAGLRSDEPMARLVWDEGAAALVCDNPAVEPQPGDPAVGSLHRRLIPLLGTTLGEMFDFERLGAACAAEGRYTFLFVANPMHVPNALGSPGNAVAIR